MLKPFVVISPLVLSALIAAPFSGRLMQQATGGAPPPHTGSSVQNPVKPTAESQAHARKLYKQECEMCHGTDGSGKTDLAKDMQLKLADWADPNTLGSRSDGEIFDIIRKGTDKMPAEAPDRAKNDDVWNLVIYIRALAKKQPVPVAAPAEGAPAAPADAPAVPPAK